MSSLSVVSPFIPFMNKAGIPLESGYVYIGVSDLNPETNPITVYWDAALTISAAQPLRTSGGYFIRSGSPSTVYASGTDFSMTVRDKLKNLIWSAPAATGISPDANGVSYMPSGTGAVITTVQNKLHELVSVKNFGAVGDNITDDTVALQKAITATRLQDGNSTKLYWNKGTYKITDNLILGTNQYIEFDPGVIINLQPIANLELTSCFVASNQTNVIIEGNGATINGTRTGAIIEGNGAGFYLYGSDNILIRNFTINDMVTDGITVTGDETGSGPCTNVILQDVNTNNSRRNGLSIISARGMQVIGGNYDASNGSPNGPWAGITIEPNANSFLENVVLIGTNTSNNDGAGIQITPQAFSTVSNKHFDVTIIGGSSVYDGADTNNAGLWFVNGDAQTNKIFGQIKVINFNVDSPTGRGVSWRNWDADKCPSVICDNVAVYNPNYGAATTPNVDRSGFVMYCDSTQATTNIGNIILRNCHAEDINVTPRMVWGFVLLTDVGKQIKNVRIEDPTAINYVASTKTEVFTYAAQTTNGMIDADIVYTTPKALLINGTLDVSIMGGKRLSATTASNFQLPLAANCKGLSYEFQTEPGIGSTSIVPMTGDTIKWYVDVASTNLVIDEGSELKIRSMGSTEWRVENIVGRYRRTGMSAPFQIQWATAAPTTSTWNRGDRVINAAPAVGSPKGWVCTVSGSPGTWVSEGNL